MKRLWVLAFILSLFTPTPSGGIQPERIEEPTPTQKADTALASSMLYQLLNNQRRLLEQQDSLINLLK